jgi:hypothetical protein
MKHTALNTVREVRQLIQHYRMPLELPLQVLH